MQNSKISVQGVLLLKTTQNGHHQQKMFNRQLQNYLVYQWGTLLINVTILLPPQEFLLIELYERLTKLSISIVGVGNPVKVWATLQSNIRDKTSQLINSTSIWRMPLINSYIMYWPVIKKSGILTYECMPIIPFGLNCSPFLWISTYEF